MSDEIFYGRVADELSRQGPIASLWAKSFAESDGDEAKAKALYLRLRVGQLKEQDRQSTLREAQQAEEAARNAERLRRESQLTSMNRGSSPSDGSIPRGEVIFAIGAFAIVICAMVLFALLFG